MTGTRHFWADRACHLRLSAHAVRGSLQLSGRMRYESTSPLSGSRDCSFSIRTARAPSPLCRRRWHQRERADREIALGLEAQRCATVHFCERPGADRAGRR